MKTPLVSLLAAGCMAIALVAAEPDAASAPAAAPAPAATPAAAPGASPSSSPVRHRRHRIAVASPSPSPSAIPKKRPWWEAAPKPTAKTTVKATPSPAPSATPRKKKRLVPAKPEATVSPAPSATPAPSASPSATPVPSPKAEPSASPEATPKKLRIRHASPGPSASPSPKKEQQGSLWTIFKHHEKKSKASPSPSASPAHKHRATTAASPSPGEAPVGESNSGPTPAPAAPEATPESTPKQPGNGMTSQVPFVPPTEKPEAPVVETKTPAEEEAEETAHFETAKAKAMQDQRIQALQAKADAATGDAARLAMRRYYKALYEKMRTIDPSLSDRIDRTEEATMRRVEQENTQ